MPKVCSELGWRIVQQTRRWLRRMCQAIGDEYRLIGKTACVCRVMADHQNGGACLTN
jgi:hypothetical protein